MAPRKGSKRQRGSASQKVEPVGIRIIGGKMGGRKLQYTGDMRTRPMKDRIRQTVFDLLGPRVKEKWVIDLFAGSGALGIEAISRGAVGATMIEQHFPTAGIIRENARSLEIEDRIEVTSANVFIWAIREPELPDDRPWVVFCSPPWSFFSERLEEMTELMSGLYARAPAGSILVVESDMDFDHIWPGDGLPEKSQWDIRPYPPAVLAIVVK